MRRALREKGFTLIELLIVVAIIGLLAAMLIPNLLDALEKAKQKKTMADCRVLGAAMMAWLTDQAAAAAAGGATGTVHMSSFQPATLASLNAVLVPQYIEKIPDRDGWKKQYGLYLNIANPHVKRVMAIRSAGEQGAFDTSDYTPGSFDPTDYVQDIVWTDGFFVRWPEKMS
ncbi:MAG TPA: prepilin-type N-terminal cleavage/methylation domain-containing protein [Thermoanaerobaculia bacterium]|jgi:type II secretion system protein G|nr:prepilin-type N-terminal cleavage/methylation domain-containing protein [Thermoanaerobaculia bacterium]